ncbi:MAG: hypothetical protein ACK45Y_11980 [Betaproteobacteria bacterium]|nr:hypothetical protein AEM42_08645 [Betaproteobacteria bacterium UKL13-2]HCG53093.1 hypothetical protein [Betaproteobacteria bacterium]
MSANDETHEDYVVMWCAEDVFNVVTSRQDGAEQKQQIEPLIARIFWLRTISGYTSPFVGLAALLAAMLAAIDSV